MSWNVAFISCTSMGVLSLSVLALVPLRPPSLDDVSATEIENSVGMKLVLIKQGCFSMGWRKGEEHRIPEREQRHTVEFARSFWMGKFEVTQQEYEQVMGANPSHFSRSGPGNDKVAGLDTRRFPVERVTWSDAKEFCRRLTQKERRAGRLSNQMEYRLPTEAEWEYCCRAGVETAFHTGETITSTQANMTDSEPRKRAPLERPTDVGRYPPNGWGLHDMHGNVWEWCEDCYDPHYYANSPRVDPLCLRGEERVNRGGCFHDGPGYCRSMYRGAGSLTWRWYSLGFRVVLRIE